MISKFKIFFMVITIFTFNTILIVAKNVVLPATGKSGMEVLNKVRDEIRAEENAKIAAEKARVAAAKAEKRKAEKLLAEKRDDMNKPIEDKIFERNRAESTRESATEDGFALGKDRLEILRAEEEEIKNLEKYYEKLSGKKVKPNKDRILKGEKFDKIYAEHKNNSKDIAKLEEEKEEIKDKIAKLEQMQKALSK